MMLSALVVMGSLLLGVNGCAASDLAALPTKCVIGQRGDVLRLDAIPMIVAHHNYHEVSGSVFISGPGSILVRFSLPAIHAERNPPEPGYGVRVGGVFWGIFIMDAVIHCLTLP
jgi:hypothetical protein